MFYRTRIFNPLFNLNNTYCFTDIRDLISLDDAVDEMEFGPNGGLVFCMEYLNANLNWLHEQIEEFDDDSYFLIDCPGQVELFTHFSMMRTLTEQFMMWNYRTCGVYLMDATFCSDAAKFLSGSLVALSTMVQLELPHINVMIILNTVLPSFCGL